MHLSFTDQRFAMVKKIALSKRKSLQLTNLYRFNASSLPSTYEDSTIPVDEEAVLTVNPQRTTQKVYCLDKSFLSDNFDSQIALLYFIPPLRFS